MQPAADVLYPKASYISRGLLNSSLTIFVTLCCCKNVTVTKRTYYGLCHVCEKPKKIELMKPALSYNCLRNTLK